MPAGGPAPRTPDGQVGAALRRLRTQARGQVVFPGDPGPSIWVSDVMWSVDNVSANINGPAPQAFSSRHPGGAFFAYSDGSVRFFYEHGDKAIVKWAAGRDDGNAQQ